MGGGGGGGYGGGGGGDGDDHVDVSQTELGSLEQRAVSEEKKAAYDADVNGYLQDLLKDFNDRDTEQIRTHIRSIQNALEKEIEGSVTLVYGGSTKKHTYVDGLSDVDMLVLLNNSELANKNPREVLEYFAQKLRDRFPGSDVKVGNLAVTVRFSGSGYEIQLLPAIRTQTGVKISKSDGSGWSGVIKPDAFASKLSAVNEQNSGKVVRVIKLFKAMNEHLPKESRLTGYHIESMAIDAFENYAGDKSYKGMLNHLVEYSKKAVLKPIQDRTSQSRNVDDNLGPADSPQRVRISQTLERLHGRMKLADSEADENRWEEMMGG